MRWGEPAFSEMLLGAYLGLMSLLWGGLTAGVGAWQRKFALPELPGADYPRLSICLPARNEAHQIRSCLEAALGADYPDLELILVDDHSTDGTAQIAASLQDPRLKILTGQDLPGGWSGKSWACQQAAEAASGELLLFIDADVELGPAPLRQAVAVLQARKLAMLSLFGTWKLESFWERVAIPVIGWFVRGATDLDAVNSPGRKEAFANGQFILVRRDAYVQTGGHGAVRASVLDDVRLAQSFKQQGLALGLYHAPRAFQVRLYRNLSEIVQGYTKNFYEGMNRNPALALGAILFLFVGSGLPYLLGAAALFWPRGLFVGLEVSWPWTNWILGICLLPLVFRWRLERADGRDGRYAWSHPVGNLVLGWVLLRSMFVVRTEWKGRSFHDGKAG